MKKALLKSEKPSVFFEVLREVNGLDFWFPELQRLTGLLQNPAFHPEGDVWVHTMQVLDRDLTIYPGHGDSAKLSRALDNLYFI